MSRLRADKLVNRGALGAPELTYGASIPVGYGLTGAGGINITGVATATSFSGALTGNVTGNINSSGVSTLGNTVVGGGTTQLIVTGNARITGILTIGTSSITLDGSNNQVNVGTGVTLHHTNGVQVGGNTLHSTVLTVNNINASGVVTATSFSGSGANLTGIGGTTDVRTNSLVVSGVSTVTTLNATSIAGITSINSGQLGGSRNMIINGSMVVNQRGFTGAAGTTTNFAYTTDRFRIEHSMDGAVSAGQTTMNSTVGGNAYADGFQSALHYRVTTADASLSSSQYALIAQPIEGFNVQGFKKGTANAQQFTLSFWVRSSLTGTYIAELYDADNTRQVSKSYTIDTANTWEKKTLTYPADTTGVFDNDNGASLYVNWWLAAGSNYTSGTLNTSWASNTSANRAVGQVNFLATAGNNFFLTGVQLEVGSTATEFERRSFPQELALCQRYFERMTGSGDNGPYAAFGTGYSTGTGGPVYVRFQSKRATPTITMGGTMRMLSSGVVGTSVSLQLDTYVSSSGNGYVNSTWSNSITAGQAMMLTANNDATAFMAASSEL